MLVKRKDVSTEVPMQIELLSACPSVVVLEYCPWSVLRPRQQGPDKDKLHAVD